MIIAIASLRIRRKDRRSPTIESFLSSCCRAILQLCRLTSLFSHFWNDFFLFVASLTWNQTVGTISSQNLVDSMSFLVSDFTASSCLARCRVLPLRRSRNPYRRSSTFCPSSKELSQLPTSDCKRETNFMKTLLLLWTRVLCWTLP
jgi:hypothetical protein